MSSNTLTPAIIWAAGQAAKVAIRRSTNPRVGAPIEDVIERGTRYLLKQAGAGAFGGDGAQAKSGVRIVTPEEASDFWERQVPARAREGSIELIVGSQRTGKTALASRLCELWQRQGKPSLWLAIDPPGVQVGLNRLAGCRAKAINRQQLMELVRGRMLRDTVVVIDDAAAHFNQFSSQTEDTQDLQAFLAVEVTKGHNHLLLLTQETGLVGRHVMQPSVVWVKPPLANYADFERGGMRHVCHRAVRGYQLIPHEEWRQWVYVEEFGAIGCFSGMVPVVPATGWSQTLSEAR